ncbi:2Fe-2S iron-sulfur cluster-binding protein [Limibacillus sp. MBR-115]|jgi:toluene monooxygenase electron transfer component|uniref:2Fe-2S iron-sulfur cluster-binding protein n=1 Tax=Limibacillus sp. MBR-115 TaxID=3156465 RepID=UPI0033937FDC
MAVDQNIKMEFAQRASQTFEVKEVSSGLTFLCRDDETVLCAAQRAGVGLAYECSVGGCGSCKVELIEGEVEELSLEAPGLRARERDKGKRLGCQVIPKSNCKVRFKPDYYYRPAIPPKKFKARFLGSTTVTHDIREFRFSGDDAPAFKPGQYAMVFLPGLSSHRPYSLSNIDGPEREWRFMVRHVLNGKGTDVLFNRLSHGQEVVIDGPYSTAYLRPEIDRDIVLIGGGSGLAPMVSILKGVAANPSMQNRSVIFYYGARSPNDIFSTDILGAAADRCKFVPAVSDALSEHGRNWNGAKGFIHDVVAAEIGTDASAFEYYMAGPPPMIDAVRRKLILDLQVPVEQLHYDRFF